MRPDGKKETSTVSHCHNNDGVYSGSSLPGCGRLPPSHQTTVPQWRKHWLHVHIPADPATLRLTHAHINRTNLAQRLTCIFSRDHVARASQPARWLLLLAFPIPKQHRNAIPQRRGHQALVGLGSIAKCNLERRLLRITRVQAVGAGLLDCFLLLRR